MNATDFAEVVAVQTDDTLRAMYLETFCHSGSSLRDERGNLRAFTPEEEAFRVALRAEWKRRGLTIMGDR